MIKLLNLIVDRSADCYWALKMSRKRCKRSALRHFQLLHVEQLATSAWVGYKFCHPPSQQKSRYEAKYCLLHLSSCSVLWAKRWGISILTLKKWHFQTFQIGGEYLDKNSQYDLLLECFSFVHIVHRSEDNEKGVHSTWREHWYGDHVRLYYGTLVIRWKSASIVPRLFGQLMA